MMKREKPKKQKKQRKQQQQISNDEQQPTSSIIQQTPETSDDLAHSNESFERALESKHDQKRTAKETTNLLNFFQDKQINILELANSFGLNVDKQTDSVEDSTSADHSSKMGKKKNQNKQQLQQQSQRIQQLSANISNDENCSFLNFYLEATKKPNVIEEMENLLNQHDKQQQQCNQNLVTIEADTEEEDDDEEEMEDDDFYLEEDESLDNEEIDDNQWEIETASLNHPQKQASNAMAKSSINQNNSDNCVAEIKRIIVNSKKQLISEDTLLLLASSSGYYELAQFLLSSKSDIKQRGLKELTHSLLEASACGHADIVQLLLQYNAKVDARTRQGNTSLFYAASHGHTNVVRVLIKHVQDKYKQSNKNISPEQFIEIYNDSGHTALMECVSANHLECAKVLINEYNASVTCQSNEYKESCLTLACYKGHFDLVKFLLELNNHHYSTEELTNALLETSLDGHVDIARLLIDQGAKVNMPEDSHFESCLNLAACGNHIELACLLLSKGANIEEVNDEGYTPLQSSVREKHEEMVALLLSKNANINYVTKETHETALGLACASNFTEIADFLIRAGANLELGSQTPLQISCQEGHLELVKHLVSCGADVNARSLGTGDTALHYAVDYPDIVRLLILSDADIEAENDSGLTCLQKAIQVGRLNTIQVLVECGANIKDLEPETTSTSITKSFKSKNNSQNKDQIPSSIKGIDPIHQRIHEQHMMLVNGENQSQLHLTTADSTNEDDQPILCEKHASEFVECSNAKRKLSQHCQSDDSSELLESQAFEQLTNYFQKQRNEYATLTTSPGNSGKKARLKQQSSSSNCSSQADENICNELLGYELLSSKKLKSAMKNQPDRCIKLIDELMFKLNSEKRLTSEAESTSSSTKVASQQPIAANHKLNALKETERLEQCINHMMRRTELLNPSKEEQIKQKKQILEELKRVEKELQEKQQSQLFLSHTHQKEKFLKSLCAQSQQLKQPQQQSAPIKNQADKSENRFDTPDTNAKLDSISFSFKKGLSKLISFNKDTTNCLPDNATNSATDHPSDCAADSSTLLSNMDRFERDFTDEKILKSLKKCDSISSSVQQQQHQQQQEILEKEQNLSDSMNKKLRNLLKTNCNLKDDLNKVLNSLSSDCSNQSNNYQMVTLPKIAEEIKKMQTHLSNQQNQLEQLDQLDSSGNQQTQQDYHQVDDEQKMSPNTDDELSVLFDTFEDNKIKLFKELSKKLNIDNPLLAKILYEFPSTSDCSEQDNQAIIIEETEEEDDLDDCLDDEEESDDDDNLTDQDEFFVEEDQLTGDHHIVHERRIVNMKQYPNIEEMLKDNHKQLFSSSEDEDEKESRMRKQLAWSSQQHQMKPNERYVCDRSTQTIFSSSPNGMFQLLRKPLRNDPMSYIKKLPNAKLNQVKKTSTNWTQTESVGKCVSFSESFVRKKSVNISSSKDHLTCDHSSSSNETLATIETLCNTLNIDSISNLSNEETIDNLDSSGNDMKNSSTKYAFSNLSKEDAESRKLFDQIMKFNKLKSENPENKDIKKMINQWVLEVSKNSHLLTKLERITSYPKETISEMVLTAKKESGVQQSSVLTSNQNKENNNATTSSTAMNETSLLLVENEGKGNVQLSNKQSAKLAKKLIKSTLKKELKSTKTLNSNTDLNKSSIKIQSATINNPHTNTSNPQSLRNHVRNIMKAKRTLNQTTITEEHHTQVTISSRSKENCSKIDLKLLEDALPPEEYNQILNQINYNYSCYKNQGKKGTNNSSNNNETGNIKNNTPNVSKTTTTTTTTTSTGIKNVQQNKSTKNPNTNSRNTKQNTAESDGKSHDTALTAACAHGHFELVKLLIGRGAKIDHRDSKGFTPLHWAAMHGHLQIIDFLINNNNTNNKVDLEAEDKLSMTPLLVAAWYGHLQVVQKLIGYGASVSKIDKRGQSIIHCASKGGQGGHVEIVKFLLDNCLNQIAIDAQDGRKLQTALHLAVINSNSEIVNRLLDCGASIKIRDKNERTVVQWAAKIGNAELLERFMQDKDNIEMNAKDLEGKSPLLLACESGHNECAQILLKSGADIYLTDNEGRTALHLAVMNNHSQIVQILVDKGAPLNSMNGRQQVPLHIACEMGFSKPAQILLAHGADYTIIEKATGKTPLLIAAFNGHVGIGALLVRRYNADMNAQLVQVNPKNTENIGYTALAICAEKGFCEFVQLLVENKANLEIKTKKGCSPLWLSCSFGQLEVVQLLVNAGADVDSQDNRKITCIMAAFRSGHVRVVKWLVKCITQFPSDNEMLRYMAISANDEEKKRNKICMDIINEEKSKQAAQANDIAQTLLEELNLEKMEEEAKKMGKKLAASKKRERKKLKRKEKEEVTKVSSESDINDMKSKDIQTNKTKVQIEEKKEEEPLRTPEVVESSVSSKDTNREKKSSKSPKTATINQAKQPQQQQTKEKKKKDPETSGHKNVEKSKTNDKSSKKSLNKFNEESTRDFVEKGSSTDTKNLDLPSNVDYLQSSTNSSTSEKTIEKCKTTLTGSKQQKEDDWKEVVRRQKKINVPANAISRVIGRGGCNIKLVREISGAHIDIENQKNQSDNQQKIVQGDRQIIIKGSNEATKNAYQLIQSLVNEPEKDINQILNQLGLSKPISATLNESSSTKTQSNVTQATTYKQPSIALTTPSKISASTKQSTSVIGVGSQTGCKAASSASAKDHHSKYPYVQEPTLYKSNNSSSTSSRKNSSTNYQHSSAEHHDESNSSQRASSIWNNDKAKESLSKLNNRVEFMASTLNEPSNVTQQVSVKMQKEMGYFSPFDSILGKVAQETIWQSTKEPVKPNFASVAAAGLNNNNISTMSNYLTNSDNSLNKSSKKAKEIQVDTSKAPGYRPTNSNIISPNHAPSSSSTCHQQQQLGSTSSNTLNQIMINSFGPIGAKSAPCTPPLSTSGSINKPPQLQPFQQARKDHFSNSNNPTGQKLISSPTKTFTTSGSHNFIGQPQYSTSSGSSYHQTKSFTSSNYLQPGNRSYPSPAHDATASNSVNLLQSASGDLSSPSLTEPLFSSTSMQNMNTVGYQTQQQQIPMQSSLQNPTTSQQPLTQPLASNLQIQMRAALLAAGAQLQHCMNSQAQIPGQNKSQQLQQLFQQAAQLQAATRFQQLNNLNQPDLGNQSNKNKLRLLQQQMQQYNMSYMRSNSQANQAPIQQQPPQQTNPNRLTNAHTLNNVMEKMSQQQPNQSPSMNTLSLNTQKLPVAGFSPNANKFNNIQQQLNPLSGLTNQFSAATQLPLQMNTHQVMSTSQLFASGPKLLVNEQSQFPSNENSSTVTTMTNEEKRLPRPIGMERAQRVKQLPEQQLNDLSGSANFNHWSSTEQDDWSANAAPLNSPVINQFSSPNTSQLLNYENALFNGLDVLKNPLLVDTENYWSAMNSASSADNQAQVSMNSSTNPNLTTLSKMSNWHPTTDWNSPKK